MTINGIEWKIAYTHPNNPVFRLNNGIYTIGVTDNATKTVYVNDRLNSEMTRKVLTHEITHCICFSYNIYLPIETEELIADFIANYGTEIITLVDNYFYNKVNKIVNR